MVRWAYGAAESPQTSQPVISVSARKIIPLDSPGGRKSARLTAGRRRKSGPVAARPPPAVSPENPDSARWYAEEVQPHAAELRAWLRGRFPALTDPDNLAQEALARVWQAHESGAVQSPRALLFATGRNLALDEMRRRQIVTFEPVTEMADLPVYADVPTAADAAAHHQELEILTKALQSQPDRCRQVLTLRKIYGLPQKEIAARLGIAEHTVEAQIAAGMRKCAVFLARFGLP